MSDTLMFFGFLLIIIGIILLSFSAGEKKIAVGGFIGPIPFGFANDPQMLKLVWIIVIIMAIIFIALLLRM